MNREPRIQRYGLTERLVHAVAGLSYVYLLLTGLAFWTPALFWLAAMLGGGFLSRMLHPWVGVLFTAAVIVMLATWRRDMRTTSEDRQWRQQIGRYIRNEDSLVPGAGRFNYGQKAFFWLMVWAGLALVLSGVVMWFVDSIPVQLHVVRTVATLTHAVAALATIGGFIVHVYMGVAVVPGGLDAILHGEVSEEWARHHHPLWFAEMQSMKGSRERR